MKMDPMVRTALLNERRRVRRQLDENRQQRKALPQVRLGLRGHAELLLDNERSHLLAQLGMIDAQLKGEPGTPSPQQHGPQRS